MCFKFYAVHAKIKDVVRGDEGGGCCSSIAFEDFFQMYKFIIFFFRQKYLSVQDRQELAAKLNLTGEINIELIIGRDDQGK